MGPARGKSEGVQLGWQFDILFSRRYQVRAAIQRHEQGAGRRGSEGIHARAQARHDQAALYIWGVSELPLPLGLSSPVILPSSSPNGRPPTPSPASPSRSSTYSTSPDIPFPQALSLTSTYLGALVEEASRPPHTLPSRVPTPAPVDSASVAWRAELIGRIHRGEKLHVSHVLPMYGDSHANRKVKEGLFQR